MLADHDLLLWGLQNNYTAIDGFPSGERDFDRVIAWAIEKYEHLGGLGPDVFAPLNDGESAPNNLFSLKADLISEERLDPGDASAVYEALWVLARAYAPEPVSNHAGWFQRKSKAGDVFAYAGNTNPARLPISSWSRNSLQEWVEAHPEEVKGGTRTPKPLLGRVKPVSRKGVPSGWFERSLGEATVYLYETGLAQAERQPIERWSADALDNWLRGPATAGTKGAASGGGEEKTAAASRPSKIEVTDKIDFTDSPDGYPGFNEDWDNAAYALVSMAGVTASPTQILVVPGNAGMGNLNCAVALMTAQKVKYFRGVMLATYHPEKYSAPQPVFYKKLLERIQIGTILLDQKELSTAKGKGVVWHECGHVATGRAAEAGVVFKFELEKINEFLGRAAVQEWILTERGLPYFTTYGLRNEPGCLALLARIREYLPGDQYAEFIASAPAGVKALNAKLPS
ncbi:hypothetical protein OHV05_38225 (plasmid) [Kitasatospora sp. NBC_00070]|uniref:hypothetical protein n=1 Tax=Kitasatospora sp. NBC_00070 TaxID=2975962 RepID=UPI0032434B12